MWQGLKVLGSGAEYKNWGLRMITVYYIHEWNVIGKPLLWTSNTFWYSGMDVGLGQLKVLVPSLGWSAWQLSPVLTLQVSSRVLPQLIHPMQQGTRPVLMPSGSAHPHLEHQGQLHCVAQAWCRTRSLIIIEGTCDFISQINSSCDLLLTNIFIISHCIQFCYDLKWETIWLMFSSHLLQSIWCQALNFVLQLGDNTHRKGLLSLGQKPPTCTSHSLLCTESERLVPLGLECEIKNFVTELISWTVSLSWLCSFLC